MAAQICYRMAWAILFGRDGCAVTVTPIRSGPSGSDLAESIRNLCANHADENNTTYYGAAYSVSIGLLVMLVGALAALPWLSWRYSLRTLLIATTLIAVVLGLIVWLR